MQSDRSWDSNRLARVLYVDVYAFMIDDLGDPKYLILQRNDDRPMEGTWQPISGKIRDGEKIREAFKRLVITKTGIQPQKLFKLDFVNVFFDSDYDCVMMVPSAAVLIKGKSIELNADYYASCLWISADEAERYLIWPNQIQCIRELDRKLTGIGSFSDFHLLSLD